MKSGVLMTQPSRRSAQHRRGRAADRRGTLAPAAGARSGGTSRGTDARSPPDAGEVASTGEARLVLKLAGRGSRRFDFRFT